MPRLIRVNGVTHSFPDDATDADISEALDGHAQPSGSGWPAKIGEVARRLGSAAVGILPTVGGVVGGIAGGIPGAAVGGAAGEGYRGAIRNASEIPGAVADVARNLVNHPSETMSGFAGGAARGGIDAAEEGAGQGAGQAVGMGLAKGAGAASKWLMDRATTRVSAKLMQDFPGLSDTLIENAITVSKGGADKARRLLMEAKGAANFALNKSNGTVPIQVTDDLAQSFKTALLERAVKAGTMPPVASGAPISVASQRLDPAMQSLFRRIDAAASGAGKLHLDAPEADLLKTQLQKESRALYANRGAPNGPKAMGMDATERAEFASRLNDAIDAIAPGYRAANTEARPLIGAVRGVQQAMRPNGNLMQAMVRPAVGMVAGGAVGQQQGGTPGAAAGAMAGAAMATPAMMSREAIFLAQPAVQALLKQLPKPAAQALIELFSAQSQDPQ